MLCARCQEQEASFLYQIVINGRVEESGLCAECHEEEAPGAWVGASPLSALLSSLRGPVKKKQGPRCSSCGLYYADFRKHGRLGCGACYDAFAEAMPDILNEVHGCSEHKGKRPDSF